MSGVDEAAGACATLEATDDVLPTNTSLPIVTDELSRWESCSKVVYVLKYAIVDEHYH